MYGKIFIYIVCLLIFSPESACSSPTIIHHAARAGDVKLLTELITKEEIPIDRTYVSEAGESEDNTPLMLAAEYGHVEAVKLLLEHGADVHMGDMFYRRVPLCFAAMNGNAEIITLLLDKKAANTNDNSLKMSPLMYAVKGGHLEAAKLILAYKGDEDTPSIDATNEWGDTALMFAVASGNSEIVKLLLTQTPNVNSAEGTFSRTAFMIAAEGGRSEIMQMLLDSGADSTHKDTYNTTALIYAANSDSVEAVKIALAHDVAINAQNTFGWSALSRAVSLGNVAMVKLLLEHKADVSIKDIKGRTPLDIAKRKKQEKIITLLQAAGAK